MVGSAGGADVPLASNKQPAECVRHTFVVRGDKEEVSLNFPWNCVSGSACLPSRLRADRTHNTVCYTVRGNNRTRIPVRVSRIGSSSLVATMDTASLPCPCLTFFTSGCPVIFGNLVSAACLPFHPTSARANYRSLPSIIGETNSSAAANSSMPSNPTTA